VVRIVAMDGDVGRLKTIAEAIHAAAPGFTVKLLKPRGENKPDSE
jgi:hypothetical protein